MAETTPPAPKYPEHEKLQAARFASQAICEFLNEFLPTKGIVLAEWALFEGRRDEHLTAASATAETLVAEFVGIDRTKLEAEKRAMLEELARMNKEATDAI